MRVEANCTLWWAEVNRPVSARVSAEVKPKPLEFTVGDIEVTQADVDVTDAAECLERSASNQMNAQEALIQAYEAQTKAVKT